MSSASATDSDTEPALKRRPRQRVVMMRGVVSKDWNPAVRERWVVAPLTALHSNPSDGQRAQNAALWWLTVSHAWQVWRSGDFTTRLWADMMRFWPAPFGSGATQPKEALVAHAGARAASLVPSWRVACRQAEPYQARHGL